MDEFQSYIHRSRYARFRDDLGRRETWEETVRRYIDYMGDTLDASEEVEARLDEVEDAILSLDVMPSMRALMTAGPALDRDNVAAFNCSYLPVESPRAFDETMYILMCGTGVGFSVERQYINQLPEVAEEFDKTDTTIVVPDSKRGWAESFRELISLLYTGRIPQWDLSKIRPKGARLKTFGGRASGPEPLDDLFNFTVNTFQKAKGRKLNSIECHDLMCKVGQVVVVGGVRRSALISLSNLTDDRMRSAKVGNWPEHNSQRALANNSVSYTEKPDVESFMKEWLSLVQSKSGERGIFYRVAANKQVERIGRREADWDWGTNPCCFTGDMRLLTDGGYKTFKDLAGLDCRIVNNNGDITKGRVWSSGLQPIVKVKFESRLDRKPIRCTPDHRFMLTDGTEVEARDLKGKKPMPFVRMKSDFHKESILAGFMLGDANLNRLSSGTHRGLEVFFGEKDKDVAALFGQETGTWYSRYAAEVAIKYGLPATRVGKRGLPKSGLLTGLFSANGSVIKGNRVSLKSTDYKQMLAVQEELDTLGIGSYITTNKARKQEFANGTYTMKESYDLNISRYDSILRFAELIGFVQEYKQKALTDLLIQRAPTVKTVVYAGEEEVFDFTEPDTHWGVVENCVVHNSEIILRPHQFCNLTEVVVRPHDTLGTLKRKVQHAVFLGTLQSMLTDFKYLRKVWKANTEEERLLGVSLTGIMDNKLTSGKEGHTKLVRLLEELKETAIEENKYWAGVFGVNVSAAITCVKPSGTVSQLVDSSSGIHGRYSPYYLRTVRGDKADPLAKFMVDQGFPHEDDVTSPEHTWVFTFPIKAPKGSVVTDDLSPIQHLELWKIYQNHWCEHKPSITVEVPEQDWMEVGAWVYRNFDCISGISFLPKDDHVYKQAPYQRIDGNEYRSWVAKMPKDVDWVELEKYETTDHTIGSQEYACTSGKCDIL